MSRKWSEGDGNDFDQMSILTAAQRAFVNVGIGKQGNKCLNCTTFDYASEHKIDISNEQRHLSVGSEAYKKLNIK